MGLLKKRIKGSTLMETLVATVLIVVVFMMASMVINNLFAGTIAQNDQKIRQELNELQYRYVHGQLQVPYQNSMGAWQLRVSNINWNGESQVAFRAVHESSKSEIVTTLHIAKD